MTIETTREGLLRLEKHLEQLKVAFPDEFARIYAAEQRPSEDGDIDYQIARKG